MRNNELHYYFYLLHMAQPGSFGTSQSFDRLFVQRVRDMGLGPQEEARGRQAMRVLQRKTGCVLTMDDSFLRDFLPPLTEVLLQAEPTRLQVALLKELQKKRPLRACDLDDCRRILTSPALLSGEKWEALYPALDMPYLWTAEEHIRQSGAIKIIIKAITSTLSHTEDKLVISSYRNEDLTLISRMCTLFRLNAGVVLLKRLGAGLGASSE